MLWVGVVWRGVSGGGLHGSLRGQGPKIGWADASHQTQLVQCWSRATLQSCLGRLSSALIEKRSLLSRRRRRRRGRRRGRRKGRRLETQASSCLAQYCNIVFLNGHFSSPALLPQSESQRKAGTEDQREATSTSVTKECRHRTLKNATSIKKYLLNEVQKEIRAQNAKFCAHDAGSQDPVPVLPKYP
eukprot:1162080-Pelagomonas_calceolata.AAC.5